MNPNSHISSIILPGSKSISNRLLMIKAIGQLEFEIENCSDSDDTQLLKKALEDIASGKLEINIHHAGTNMRFLCSFLSLLENKTSILTGSEHLKQRPIKDLVDALTQLGSAIEYVEKEGFPPLKITGKKLSGNQIEVNANVSSQFITSLLLIAPQFSNGLTIKLVGQLVSPSYITLTIELMKSFGIEVEWKQDTISVGPSSYQINQTSIYNESDWSAASYFYSAIALGKCESLELTGLNKQSLQPDSKVADIFLNLGVKTEFLDHKVILTKITSNSTSFKYDFTDCPDIAQTLAVTCVGLGLKAEFTGLQTLKIKETDRIVALKTELEKCEATIEITNNSLNITDFSSSDKNKTVTIQTYNDHRMAMSFAPLSFLYPNLKIDNKDVVSKSFPNFWNEFSKCM